MPDAPLSLGREFEAEAAAVNEEPEAKELPGNGRRRLLVLHSRGRLLRGGQEIPGSTFTFTTILRSRHTHTHSHSYMHSNTHKLHTYTHAGTHTSMHTHIYTHIHMQAHTHKHAHTHARTHAGTHGRGLQCKVHVHTQAIVCTQTVFKHGGGVSS